MHFRHSKYVLIPKKPSFGRSLIRVRRAMVETEGNCIQEVDKFENSVMCCVCVFFFCKMSFVVFGVSSLIVSVFSFLLIRFIKNTLISMLILTLSVEF